jgi:hypothetical protein
VSNLQSLLQFLAATPASAKSLDQRQKEALLKLNELPERDGVTYYGPGTTEGNPQKQNVVEITAPPVPQEVVITDLKDRIKSNPAEFARENYNNLIPQMMTENESNRDRLMNLDKEANLTRSAQVSLLQKLQENQPSYVSPYKEAIDTGLKNVENVKPQTGNPYADLLTVFLPTILGSGLGFGGTAGARTAAQTTPMAIGLVRENMKQREAEAKNLRDDLVKKVNAYIGADKVARESFTGEQKALFDRIQASVKMLEGFDQRNENEKRQILQNARAVNQEANKTIVGGIDKIADLETRAQGQEIAKRNTGIAAAKAAKTTESERKAAAFYSRAVQAEKTLDTFKGNYPSLTNRYYDILATIEGGETAIAPIIKIINSDIVNDPQVRKQMQAEFDWVLAVLRPDTGAALPASEFQKYASAYFPRKGDSAEVIAQKKASREQAVLGIKAMAGNAPVVPQVQNKAVPYEPPKPNLEKRMDAKPDEKDKAAIEWLRANPNSPKAEAVMQKLKLKGIL